MAICGRAMHAPTDPVTPKNFCVGEGQLPLPLYFPVRNVSDGHKVRPYWLMKSKAFCCRTGDCPRRAFPGMGKAIVRQGNVQTVDKVPCLSLWERWPALAGRRGFRLFNEKPKISNICFTNIRLPLSVMLSHDSSPRGGAKKPRFSTRRSATGEIPWHFCIIRKDTGSVPARHFPLPVPG